MEQEAYSACATGEQGEVTAREYARSSNVANAKPVAIGGARTVLSQDRRQCEQFPLVGAVEGMCEGVAFFDRNGRLSFCNEQFKKLNPELAPCLEPGISYEEMLRHSLEKGLIVEAVGCEEEYLESRLAYHRKPGKPILSRRKGSQWLLLREERGALGGPPGGIGPWFGP